MSIPSTQVECEVQHLIFAKILRTKNTVRGNIPETPVQPLIPTKIYEITHGLLYTVENKVYKCNRMLNEGN